MRAATLEDIDQLQTLEESCFPSVQYQGSILSRRQFRYALKNANARTVVSTDTTGNITGYAMIFFRRGSAVARLYSLAISPDFRGQGIGLKLARKASDIAREKGCKQIMLETRTDNKTMIALATKMGYRLVKTLPAYYPNQVDGLKYRLDL